MAGTTVQGCGGVTWLDASRDAPAASTCSTTGRKSACHNSTVGGMQVAAAWRWQRQRWRRQQQQQQQQQQQHQQKMLGRTQLPQLRYVHLSRPQSRNQMLVCRTSATLHASIPLGPALYPHIHPRFLLPPLHPSQPAHTPHPTSTDCNHMLSQPVPPCYTSPPHTSTNMHSNRPHDTRTVPKCSNATPFPIPNHQLCACLHGHACVGYRLSVPLPLRPAACYTLTPAAGRGRSSSHILPVPYPLSPHSAIKEQSSTTSCSLPELPILSSA
jgi:hypothetical protein